MPTSAPARARASTTARPMPTAPPVTSATRPVRSWGALTSVLPVAARVGLVPLPRRLDDGAEVGVARRPAQLGARLLRRRHQLGRVAGAARRVVDQHDLAG